MINLELAPATGMQRLSPSLAALLLHLPALSLGWLLLLAGLPWVLAIAVVGISAALLAWHAGLPAWWRLINLLFVPALWLGLQAEFNALWFLLGFVLLGLTSLGAASNRVPLYFSSTHAVQALADLIPQQASYMDLGCALGGTLARLHALRPDLTLYGVESAPLNWLVARLRLARRAHISPGSLWWTDLSHCDVVYAYLSPAVMERLWQKLRREMRPGSLFISNSFAIPGVPPDECIELSGCPQHAPEQLLIWQIR